MQVSRGFRPVLISLFFFGLPIFNLSLMAGSSVPGIQNFYRVDEHVYRGAQPTNDGLKYLAKMGVKTILDLRERDERSLAEERAVTALGMQYVNVAMSGLTPPTEAQITRVLGLLEDSSSGAVFVHCRRGADRTGSVIAAYRIDHDHWDNARALKEAMADGMSFFQLPRQHYIRRFQPRIVQAKAPANEGAPNPAASAAAVVPVPAGQ